MIKSYIR